MNQPASVNRANLRLLRRHRAASGFLYVAVLFTTLLVMVVVSAALSISTSNLRGETDRTSRGEALRLAESAIQRQAAIMRTSSQWRTDSTNNVFSNWYGLTLNGQNITGSSQIRHRYYDSDGDLADDFTDPVELTVHVKVGRSQRAVSVQFASDPEPFDLLDYAVTASRDLRIESNGALSCERAVQVDADGTGSNAGILTAPRLHCSGSVDFTLRGDLSPSSVVLPANDVLAKYIELGTQIPTAPIPRSGGDWIIRDRVLSPTVNPFGPLDSNGIYWFDAGGDTVIISHCRFDATLAIRDAGEILVEGGIAWSYPTSADAILVSDSRIRFQNMQPWLVESDRSVNFNPPASPYRGSMSNNTLIDTYPTEFRGVIYTTDNLRMDPLSPNRNLHVTGALIGDEVRIEGAVTVTQLRDLNSMPSAGLSDPTPMRFVRGTWRRIPTP